MPDMGSRPAVNSDRVAHLDGGEDRLTILNVSHRHYIGGGSDRYFLDLGKLLEGQGHAVIPFCSDESANEPSEYSGYFPRPVSIDRPGVADLINFVYYRSARRSIERLLDDIQVDLAHLHIYYGKLGASIIKPLRDRGVPIVQTLHEYKLICPVYTLISGNSICEACKGRKFRHALPRRCNRGSLHRTALSVVESYVSDWLGARDSIDHFIGISQFMTDKMIQHGVPEDKITTIHNFVDVDRYEATSAPGDYVLYFGRLEKVKGIYTLLEAMKSLPDVNCVVAGSGSELDQIQEWILSNGLRNVELVGFVRDDRLHDLIRGAVCTVIPSEWYEPFGLTVLESMALGRPVVGSNIGGIPEIIDDGVDGYLVEPGDSNALAEAITKLARNPAKAAAMGQEGRRKVERDFGPDLFYAQLEQVYAKARDRI